MNRDGTELDRAAYDAVLPSALALEARRLRRIATNPSAAAESVFPKLRALAALRPEVEKDLPFHDLGTFDALEQRARALRHAHRLYRATVAATPDIGPSADRVQDDIDELRGEYTRLVRRGVIPRLNTQPRCPTSGHRQRAARALQLVAHLRTHWPSLEGKTTLQPARLAAVEAHAERLSELLSLRARHAGLVTEAARIRTCVYTLFMESVESVTRAALYLRENEVRRHVPSVFGGHGRKQSAAHSSS